MNNWFYKDSEITADGRGALFLSAVAVLGLVVMVRWQSDVEEALETRMRYLAALQPHIASVECDSPGKGKVDCRVEFVSETTLPNVEVALSLTEAPFPAGFTISEDRRNYLRLRTDYEGHEFSFEPGAAALQSSILKAVRAAEHKLGPKLAAGMNALSYSKADPSLSVREGEAKSVVLPGAEKPTSHDLVVLKDK